MTGERHRSGPIDWGVLSCTDVRASGGRTEQAGSPPRTTRRHCCGPVGVAVSVACAALARMLLVANVGSGSHGRSDQFELDHLSRQFARDRHRADDGVVRPSHARPGHRRRSTASSTASHWSKDPWSSSPPRTTSSTGSMRRMAPWRGRRPSGRRCPRRHFPAATSPRTWVSPPPRDRPVALRGVRGG